MSGYFQRLAQMTGVAGAGRRPLPAPDPRPEGATHDGELEELFLAEPAPREPEVSRHEPPLSSEITPSARARSREAPRRAAAHDAAPKAPEESHFKSLAPRDMRADDVRRPLPERAPERTKPQPEAARDARPISPKREPARDESSQARASMALPSALGLEIVEAWLRDPAPASAPPTPTGSQRRESATALEDRPAPEPDKPRPLMVAPSPNRGGPVPTPLESAVARSASPSVPEGRLTSQRALPAAPQQRHAAPQHRQVAPQCRIGSISVIIEASPPPAPLPAPRASAVPAALPARPPGLERSYLWRS